MSEFTRIKWTTEMPGGLDMLADMWPAIAKDELRTINVQRKFRGTPGEFMESHTTMRDYWLKEGLRLQKEGPEGEARADTIVSDLIIYCSYRMKNSAEKG